VSRVREKLGAPSTNGRADATTAGARLKSAILAEVVEYLRRFVVFTDEQALTVGLWVFHTWALDVAQQTPYLLVTSPEKGCGKSRLQEVAELLVKRPWMTVLTSEAVLYRKIEAQQPTLLLDEADTIFAPGRKGDRYESVRAVLNAGHRRGAVVPRCVGPGQVVKDFHVFCPKMIAGIGVLPDTITDRGVPIRMERKTTQESVEDFFYNEEEVVAHELRDRVAAWAEQHQDELAVARPDRPDQLSDRLREGTQPLLAIADLLGCGDEARRALVKLCTGERADNVESQRVRLLRDIRDVFGSREAEIGHRLKAMRTKTLLHRLHALDESEWRQYYGRRLTDKDLANLLRPYGVHPTTIRFQRVGPKKGYKRGDLAHVWERYV
jgi:hypothetical protein